MLVSYNWLQTFFATPLPTPDEVATALTFYSSEIDGVESIGNDVVFDVKILPDKAAWLLSHRGVAKELSVIFNLPLKNDPFYDFREIPSLSEKITITLRTTGCDYYTATLIENIIVGPAPTWLQERLEAVGQKSINNVVDITNYVMLTTGQPLHAFDATKLTTKGGMFSILVREAKEGEPFVSLSGEKYTLHTTDTVIVDGDDTIVALAGVKGGLQSGVTKATTSILLEVAHFNRLAVRKTAQRQRLLTDASKRYENGIPRMLIPPSIALASALFSEIASGTVVGTATVGEKLEVRSPVTVSLAKINSVLGISLSLSDVVGIIERFGYEYTSTSEVVTIVPPAERDDLLLPINLIEEFGRIYGLDKIISIPPQLVARVVLNKRHYYAELIRHTLIATGFSEVYTSSFRNQDEVKIQNALASDKGYLRSSLVENLREARTKNIPYRDLLGISAVQLFEIGTVFGTEKEEIRVGLAVQTNTSYKAKIDDGLWQEAIGKLESVLEIKVPVLDYGEGLVEFSLDAMLPLLPEPSTYQKYVTASDVTYQTVSLYPPVSRDIALWVSEGTVVADVTKILSTATGPLLARLTHLDTFTNDEGRTSVAFRLVFQSKEKTLTGSEVDVLMQAVYDAVVRAGWSVR